MRRWDVRNSVLPGRLILGASICIVTIASAPAVGQEPDLAVFDGEGDAPFGDWSREVATGASGWSPQQIVTSPVRAGTRALRVEIQYAQPSVAGSARSEITRDTSDYTTDWWYGFSVYLPPEFTADSVPEIVAQWHELPDFALGEDWRSPPLSLITVDGSWILSTAWCAAPVNSNQTVDGRVDLDLGPYATSAWTDWVVHIRWGWGNDGLLEVWKNGQKVVERLDQPNAYNDLRGPYFKIGLYKWEWPAGGDGSPSTPTRVAFYDEIRQARATAGYGYADVAPAGSNAPPQVDAGADQVVLPPGESAQLLGVATDDDGPALTTTWSLVSGPAAAVIEQPGVLGTRVTMPEPGAYVLRLTASDGQLSASDEVTILRNTLANSTTRVSDSANFAAGHEVAHLWDGLTDEASEHTAGAESASFWVEFDLGQSFDLTRARLFGDAVGNWTSTSWTLQGRLADGDAWSDAFTGVSALANNWSDQPLTLLARYVRVEVFGNPATGATQARELELLGSPHTPADDDAGPGDTDAEATSGACGCTAPGDRARPGVPAALLLLAACRGLRRRRRPA